MATGLVRESGQPIRRQEVPEAVFDRWIGDGTVTEAVPSPEPEPEAVESSLPEPLKIPAYALPEPELREYAKELGISHYWNKSLSRLIDEVEAAR